MPCELYDYGTPGTSIYVDDAGNVGFACLADATHPVSLFGTPLIDFSGRFPTASVPPPAVQPVSAVVTVPANGTASVTTGSSTPLTVSAGQNQNLQVTTDRAGTVTLKNYSTIAIDAAVYGW